MSTLVQEKTLFKEFKAILDSSLTADDPITEHPGSTIRIPLHRHQLSVLNAMGELEKKSIKGIKINNSLLYTSYGILGDSVGAGKSLMVLAHIASLKGAAVAAGDPIDRSVSLESRGPSSTLFSIKVESFSDCSEGNAIIIVPHTLFRQWANYIKDQTTLKAVCIDRRKVFKGETFLQDVLAADVVLISNTFYKEFSLFQRHNAIYWRRAYIDEIDTISITNGYPLPSARFTWYITASWMNVIFATRNTYLRKSALQDLIYTDGAPFECLKPYFDIEKDTNHPYVYTRFPFASFNAFSNIISFYHTHRGRVLIKCADDYVRQSIQLPPLHRRLVICRPPPAHSIVAGAINQDIQEMLHGGDLSGAMAALGVKSDTTTNLVEAVTQNLQKELERLEKTYEFKESLEYSSASAKKAALESLKEKIDQKRQSLKELRDRIESYKNDACPICYDEPAERLLTPCCSRMFCAQCILTCLVSSNACPMCREALAAKNLMRMMREEDAAGLNTIVAAAEKYEKKGDALLRILKENPTGKFLIFSRYENPFEKMEVDIHDAGIRVKQVKGSMDSVAATLRQFEAGKIQCLLLSSRYAGCGLNITAASHVVLMHAMTHAEEKQILGRAHRIGRTESLHMYKLIYETEMGGEQ